MDYEDVSLLVLLLFEQHQTNQFESESYLSLTGIRLMLSLLFFCLNYYIYITPF
jgi:hypothetical protein